MTTNNLSTERQPHHKAIGNPFGIILNPSGLLTVMAGQTCILSLSLINEGNASPLVNVLVDETTQPVRGWCRNPEQRLALGLGQSSEVLFEFEIPIATVPGAYDYTLIIDAPEHYPEETPILLEETLQVLPHVQDAQLASDPTFALQPETSAITPVHLQQGQALEMAAIVQNRSDRVDRFYLTCPELEPEWYKVIYPETYSPGGIVTTETSLELNPGDQGTIRLLITPPVGIRARVYSPTIYLKSVNDVALALLDVVYFQIIPVYLLTAELVPIVSRVTQQDGQYLLFLRNSGNTERKLLAQLGQTPDKSCEYGLQPEAADILPGGSAALTVTIHPKQRWKRPFYGKTIEFAVLLEDLEAHPLPSDRFQGSVVWDGRPWWQFLIVILSALGFLGLLIFVIWLMLPRPPRSPEILEFYPQSNYYEEENDDVVRLSWRLNEPQNLANLQIQGISPEGLVTSRPVTYDFTGGLPERLQDYCKFEDVLICVNVPTDARQAGDYIFELAANPVPKRRGGWLRRMLSRIWRTPYSAATQQTKIVRMAGLPVPKVVSFKASQSSYSAAIAPPPKIDSPEEDAESSESSESSEKPKEEDDKTPSATIPPNFNAPIFSLQPTEDGITPVTPATPEGKTADGKTADGKTTDPKADSKADSQSTPAATTSEEEANETTTQPDAAAQSGDTPKTPERPFRGILLNWELTNVQHIKALKLVGQDAEKTVVGPDLTFDFSEGIPPELEDYCQIQGRALQCFDVPTAIATPGTYTFTLTPIPRQADLDPPIEPSVTDPIKVLSAPIAIKAFQINGVDALPKYVMQLSAKPILLTIAWDVRGGKDLTVELLPSPGSVATAGSITYPLSQEAGVEMITIKAKNSAGDEISRTVTIEKSAPAVVPGGEAPAGETPTPAAPAGAPGGSAPGDPPAAIPAIPPPAAPPAPADAAPAAPGGDASAPAAPPAPPTQPPSEEAPSLPSPPSSSPPPPRDRNTPPPAELPPTLY